MNKFILTAPGWYWAIPKYERERGKCGPGEGFWEWVVPETVWGMSITDCCQLHDKEYSLWNPEIKLTALLDGPQRTEALLRIKDKGDTRFLMNMIRKANTCSTNGLIRWFRKRRIYTVYDAVSSLGESAFINGINKRIGGYNAKKRRV